MKKKKSYKFNDIKRAQWLKAYENTGSFTNACQAVGIDRSTVYLVLKADKDFTKQKEGIDNLIDDAVESRLHALTKTSPVACFFWLCNRRGERWKNIQKLEHTGSVSISFDKRYEKL